MQTCERFERTQTSESERILRARARRSFFASEKLSVEKGIVKNSNAQAVAKRIGDTGAAHHLINKKDAKYLEKLNGETLTMATANGTITSKEVASVNVPSLGEGSIQGRVLDDTPNVLSIGRLIIDQGFFVSLERRMVSPTGNEI